MGKIPVLAFSAYAGVGKTTLIEKLIGVLKRQGLRVAVLKHDGHNFETDCEGKDSWRFTKAGADISIICSDEKTAIVEQYATPLPKLLQRIQNVDIILVEGGKNVPMPQIGLSRGASGKGLPNVPERYVAIVTDEDIATQVPKFSFEDVEGIATFIMTYMLALHF